MLGIKNNLMADAAARHLGKAYNALATSVERLASGLRINSAKDDAAGMACVRGYAVTFQDYFALHLAAHLGGAFELTRAEIAGREPSRFIDDIGENVGSVRGQTFAGDGMLLERLCELLDGRLHQSDAAVA